MAMTMFTSLMALALQIDNSSEEEKMQKATAAAVSKSCLLYTSKVIPIMNKVRNELQDKMAAELKEHTSSFAGLMASTMFTSLMALALQIDNSSEEEDVYKRQVFALHR